MSALRTEIEHLLMVHREDHPLCDECRRLSSDYPAWRRHVAEVVMAARDGRKTAPAGFADLLAEHTPYTRCGGLQCHACLDGVGGGEFKSTREWAQHFEAEIAKAGLRVVTR